MPIARAFTDDPELMAESAHALRVMNLVMALIGFQVVATGFFQSIGKAGISIFLSLTRQLIFLLPALIVLPHFFGVEGVWYSIPLADATSTIVTAAVLFYNMSKFRKKGKAESNNTLTEKQPQQI